MSTGLDFDTSDAFLPALNENKPPYDEVDVSSKEFWLATFEEREKSFAILRAERPVSWQRPIEDAVLPDPDDPGYWAIVRHADIAKISKTNEMFISGPTSPATSPTGRTRSACRADRPTRWWSRPASNCTTSPRQ